MNVVITDAAYSDMPGIGRFIVLDSPNRAETFVSELFESCRKLELMPGAYPLLPRREESRIRRKVHGNYLTFFRITDASVDILHVLHGARDYDRILFAQ